MKKIIGLLLAAMMLATCACLSSCGKNEADAPQKDLSEVDLHDVVKAVTDVLDYDGLVSEFTYKEDDTDEMVLWTYGLIEAACYEKLTDYVITLPTDYNQSFAVFEFDETVTEEELEEVKTVVNTEYVKARASSLQMYMPEEYECVKWQLENPDAIWKQYNNCLVLIMYGAERADAGFDAIDALLK